MASDGLTVHPMFAANRQGAHFALGNTFLFDDLPSFRRTLVLPDHERRAALRDPRVPDLVKKLGTTRSAAALELWRDRLAGALVAIGNAPTALFHLLEMIGKGAPKPAAILGIPVGFVGAAESKEALAVDPSGVPFLIVRGRIGGSPMTAAAVNALARAGL